MKRLLKGALIIFGLLAMFSCQDVMTQGLDVTENLTEIGSKASAPIPLNFHGEVYLKSLVNGKYVCAEQNNNGKLVADRDLGQGWEKFELSAIGSYSGYNGYYTIRSTWSWKYVCADQTNGNRLAADRDVADDWEEFKLVPYPEHGDNVYALKSSTGQYVSVTGGDRHLVANVSGSYGLSEWELFEVIEVNGGINPDELTVTYLDKDVWNNGYNGKLIIHNGTNMDVDSWEITFDAPKLSALYSCNWTQVGSKVTVTPKAGGISTIPAGAWSPDIVFTTVSGEEFSLARPSDLKIVNTGSTDPPIPQTPQNLRGTPGDSRAVISWDASEHATTYHLYRTTSGGGTVQWETANLTFTDEGLTNGTTYYYYVSAENVSGVSSESTSIPVTPEANGIGAVSEHGDLQLLYKDGDLGYTICDEDGNPYQLRGFSQLDLMAHDTEWVPGATIPNLVALTGSNAVRIAMYTSENGQGYMDVADKEAYRARVKALIQDAIDEDIYIMIDWHILNDGGYDTRPFEWDYWNEARLFFEDIASSYGSYDNVIFELCNEPKNVSFTEHIKPYAEYVLEGIRMHSDNLAIVGTPNWSSDVKSVIGNKITINLGRGVLYARHFYAASHLDGDRQNTTEAIEEGIPVMLSEWGTVDYTGGGAPNFDSSDKWLDWARDRNISWFNWSFSKRNETSAALKPDRNLAGPWVSDDFTKSGEYIINRLTTE